jgi:hypothetical protein
MSNTDSKFMQDEELRGLLNQWSAPEAPPSLDQRVAASFQTMNSERLSSVLGPQRENEVVKMKFCNTCQEQFADRFSFCPVDGTPLSAVPAVSACPQITSRRPTLKHLIQCQKPRNRKNPVVVPPAPNFARYRSAGTSFPGAEFPSPRRL